MSVESTDQGPADYFHFGVMFWGLIITVAGVVTVCIATALVGLILVLFATAYFTVQSFLSN